MPIPPEHRDIICYFFELCLQQAAKKRAALDAQEEPRELSNARPAHR